MKKIAWSVIFFSAAGGCDINYSSKSTIEVEGDTHTVMRMVASDEAYVAYPSDTIGGFVDPNDFRKNILAIEAVSGCTVVTGSVVNSGAQTKAAVVC